MNSVWHILSEACGVLEKHITNVQGQMPNLIFIVKNLFISAHCNAVADTRKITFICTSKAMVSQDVYCPAQEAHIDLMYFQIYSRSSFISVVLIKCLDNKN